MEPDAVIVVAVTILGFGIISRRLRHTIITPPMVLVAFGFLLSKSTTVFTDLSPQSSDVSVLAGLTLVVILFTDAARIDIGLLRREHRLPIRLLTIGLPLTIILGIVTAKLIFPEFSLWQAAVLAANLAPTDIALGQSFVGNKDVPIKIRQALGVESGLNDGICLPFFLIAICGAELSGHTGSLSYWIRFGILQIPMGIIVGVSVGYVGGLLIQRAVVRGWMSLSFERLSSIGLALFAYGFAELVGGNGFIAAFCGGLTFGSQYPKLCRSLLDFAETEGQLLTLLIFLTFGALFVPFAIENATPAIVLYSILSLTIIRMLPAFVSLIGTGLEFNTRLILGWFGPRGVASIVFVLILIRESTVPHGDQIAAIAVTTILISVFAHGITASPLALWYARQSAQSKHRPGMPEHKKISEMPIRD